MWFYISCEICTIIGPLKNKLKSASKSKDCPKK